MTQIATSFCVRIQKNAFLMASYADIRVRTLVERTHIRWVVSSIVDLRVSTFSGVRAWAWI